MALLIAGLVLHWQKQKLFVSSRIRMVIIFFILYVFSNLSHLAKPGNNTFVLYQCVVLQKENSKTNNNEIKIPPSDKLFILLKLLIACTEPPILQNACSRYFLNIMAGNNPRTIGSAHKYKCTSMNNYITFAKAAA